MYNYDRGGNITSKVKYAYTTGTVGTAIETIPYTYGDANWKDKLTSYNGQTITYDTIGNPLNDGTWSYSWGTGRQLRQMSKTGTTVQFKYNHNGLRTQKITTENGITTTTDYTLHGKLLTHMKQGVNDLHFFYDAQSCPVKVNFNGAFYTYTHNLQGDIIEILDSAGVKMVEYKYDAWGRKLSVTGSLAATLGKINPFRYRGYVYDEETELYYLRSRYFNPKCGRFVNADVHMGWPWILGKNLYIYCGNTPIISTDMDGFSPDIAPSPSRPKNWDTAFFAKMFCEKIAAKAKQMVKSVISIAKSSFKKTQRYVQDVYLVAKAATLSEYGGGVIEFKSGLKATCYLADSWKVRPESDWPRRILDGGLMAAGSFKWLGRISPYATAVGLGMYGMDVCNDIGIDMVNSCIDSPDSIGWISWERSKNTAAMPTAWNDSHFTPFAWFGEIESVELF